MSFNPQARTDVAPAHVGYPAWWVVPISYRALPGVAAATDIASIVALSTVLWLAYAAVFPELTSDLGQFVGVVAAIAVGFSTAAHARGLYHPTKLIHASSLIWRAWGIWGWTFLWLAILGFALRIGHMFSRAAVLLVFCAGLAAIAGIRIGLPILVRRVIAAGLLSPRRIVLLTDETTTSDQQLANLLEQHGYVLSRVFTVPSDDEAARDNGNLSREISGAFRYVRQRRPDELLLAVGWHRAGVIREVLREMKSVAIPVRLLSDPDLAWLLDRPLQDLGPMRAVQLQGPPLSSAQRAAKRLLDLLLASCGVVLLLPVLIAIALAIRLDSPGPVLFRQARTGCNGRAFRIYKFRTMTALEDGPSIQQARRNDPRVTRVGRLLRQWSLDELPQLINVLRGEMSLVGPRPHALAHDDQYSQLIYQYAARHKMKPGITGWAQVNGCRGETLHVDMMVSRVDHDRWYIDSWSLWLDLRILAMTVVHVLKHRDVY